MAYFWLKAVSGKWELGTRFPSLLISALLGGGLAAAQEAEIVVHADQVSHRVSRYLTGACIEDVNHEIYGGLYSQMIFGESFQEPPRSAAKGVHRLQRHLAVQGRRALGRCRRWPKADCGPTRCRDRRGRCRNLSACPKAETRGSS